MSENMESMNNEGRQEDFSEEITWINPKDGSVHKFKSTAEKMQFIEEQNDRDNN